MRGELAGLKTRFARVMAELFANAEINREPRWQILSKLAVASLALHAVVLASLFYVPAVRDMFNIAALISDTGYVDKAYTKSEIGEDVQEDVRIGDLTAQLLRRFKQPLPQVPQFQLTLGR